ncbi:MAG: class I SAM-dependent methyltransferase [Chlamydiae bacterium CG10_big_fil_rev_8_21_14_0_10_42_34]|nr:MAG: class I SAM-dependent methyltransferase [Chlamydiae bacterium CG10_big_fil_rev_8_21_14_0_10_42_34]
MSSTLLKFGDHWSFNIRNDPKRLAFVLARYHFATKMMQNPTSVLELGCSEGVGAPILTRQAKKYTGIDLDMSAIKSAQTNFPEDKFQFTHDDFMGNLYGKFDAVVSLDVVEHILPEFEHIYFETVRKNVSDEGICIIGTPNITAAPFASEASQLGHVNLFTQKRLTTTLGKYFKFVFPFGMNDEVVHTGFSGMSHYLICIGFN